MTIAGIEGTFLEKKQKKTVLNVNTNMHVGLGRQLKEAEATLAEEDVPIDCSPPYTQEQPKENFLEVLLATLGVRKCHGCKGQIIRKNCQLLKDLVFHMQVLQYGSHIQKVQSGTNVMTMSFFR